MEQNYENMMLHYATNYYNHLLRRTTLQVVLSVLLLISLFLFYNSSGISMFPHEYSFNVYLSTLLFSRLTQSLVERKYMFLICNGILAFLAKSTSSSSASSSQLSESTTGSHVDVEVIEEVSSGEVVHEQEDYQNGDLHEDDDDEEVENSVDLAENDQYKQEQRGDEEQDYEEEEENLESDMGCDLMKEEGERGQIREIATEELNKKIEEFILKMKEEIRIEAQHQLIAV